MPTKNPRINVALEKPIYSLIEKLAQQRGSSLSMVTRDLIREALEIHEDAIQKGERVVIIDDLMATGGTISAAANLVEKLGGLLQTTLSTPRQGARLPRPLHPPGCHCQSPHHRGR